MDLRHHPTLGPLAEAQHGVLSTRQLNGQIARGAVRAAVDARRWSRSARGVIVLHNTELTDPQRIWVALLQCPTGSAVSGPTAAALDGMPIIDQAVHVTIPCGYREPIAIGAQVQSGHPAGSRQKWIRCTFGGPDHHNRIRSPHGGPECPVCI